MMNTAKNNKILIVDDDKINLLMLIDVLKQDYNLCLAKDGEEAIKNAEKHLPDLILLDIILPDIDGYEVLAKLHEKDETKGIPVILLTGLMEKASEEKGIKLGAVDFVTKPFNPSVLKEKVIRQIKIINDKRG